MANPWISGRDTRTNYIGVTVRLGTVCKWCSQTTDSFFIHHRFAFRRKAVDPIYRAVRAFEVIGSLADPPVAGALRIILIGDA